MPSKSISVPKKAWDDLLELWEDAMEKRFSEAYKWWGIRADKIVWPILFDQLKTLAHAGCLDKMDPEWIVDNYLVNGEIVVKSNFKENGYWDYYWRKYNGDWKKLCEDAIVHADDPKENDSYALMRY